MLGLLSGNAALSGGIRHGGGHRGADARVEGTGQDVVSGQFLCTHQGGDGVAGGQLHLLVDIRSTHI